MGDSEIKIVLRVPNVVANRVAEDANANNRSMNSEIIARLAVSPVDLRDKFAIAALTGLYACRDLQMSVLHDLGNLSPGYFEGTMARQAYLQAEAMMIARKGGA